MTNRIKYLYSTIIALLIFMTATSGSLSQGEYMIKGTVKGLKDGQLILSYRKSKTAVFRDTVKVTNGQFTLKGAVDQSTRCYISIKEAGIISFYLENSHITVDGNISDLSAAVIKGSSAQDDYVNYFQKVKKPIYDQYAEIYKKKYSASTKGEIKLDPQTQLQFNQEFEKLDKQDDVATAVYIKAHADSYALPEIIYDRYIVMKFNDKAKQFFDLLNPGPQGSLYGQLIKEQVDLVNRTASGHMAPDFEMKDTNGKAVKLSDFKGKYVLIDFWASWCGPCRKENPNVVKTYQKYKDKNFTVLGVSLDRADGKAAWLKAIKDDRLDWTQVSDLKYFDNAAAKLYGVVAIPQNFLISPEGKLIATGLRGEDLENKLASLIK
jgi:peroxiredoxin